MVWVALVTLIMLLEYMVFSLMVGYARVKSKIDAPVMSGDPRLERTLRVQGNTLEQLLIAIPAMWLFAEYLNAPVAAGLGFLFVLARVIYCLGYLADPKKRGPGFGMGFLAILVLLLGAFYGVITAL